MKKVRDEFQIHAAKTSKVAGKWVISQQEPGIIEIP